MPLIEVHGLRSSYGELEVLHGIDLFVEANEIVCLIGANGAGKSTLLRCISGLVPLDAGELRFAGQSLERVASHQIPALGIAHVPEGRHIFGNLTVLENLRLGHLAAAGRVGRQSQLEAVLSLFPILADRRSQLGSTLSGGEQQMLAIGRAMMSAPRLLLLDEPSLGLSPIMVDRVFQTIGTLNEQGMTILLIEQNAFRALEVVGRGYILDRGQIVMAGSAEELKADETVQRLYFGG